MIRQITYHGTLEEAAVVLEYCIDHYNYPIFEENRFTVQGVICDWPLLSMGHFRDDSNSQVSVDLYIQYDRIAVLKIRYQDNRCIMKIRSLEQSFDNITTKIAEAFRNLLKQDWIPRAVDRQLYRYKNPEPEKILQTELKRLKELWAKRHISADEHFEKQDSFIDELKTEYPEYPFSIES